MKCSKPLPASLRLSEVPNGSYRCDKICLGDDDANRIQRLGICEGLDLAVLVSGDPMIVMVANTQIGLAKQLAENVYVVEI